MEEQDWRGVSGRKTSPAKGMRLAKLQSSIASRQMLDQTQARESHIVLSSSPSLPNLKLSKVPKSQKSLSSSSSWKTLIETTTPAGAIIDATSKSEFKSHLEYRFDQRSSGYTLVDERGYYTPSDRIGRNYSPTATALTFRDVEKFSIKNEMLKVEPVRKSSPTKTQTLSPVALHRTQSMEKFYFESPEVTETLAPTPTPQPSPIRHYEKSTSTFGRPSGQILLASSPTRASGRIQKLDFSTWTPKERRLDDEEEEVEAGVTMTKTSVSPTREIIISPSSSSSSGEPSETTLKAYETQLKVFTASVVNMNTDTPRRILNRVSSSSSSSSSAFTTIPNSCDAMMGEIQQEYLESIGRAILTYHLRDPSFGPTKGIIDDLALLPNSGKTSVWTNDQYQVREWRILRETGIDPESVSNARDSLEVFLHTTQASMAALQTQWLTEAPPAEWDLARAFVSAHESSADVRYPNILFTDIATEPFANALPLSMRSFVDNCHQKTKMLSEGFHSFWISACVEKVNAVFPSTARAIQKHNHHASASSMNTQESSSSSNAAATGGAAEDGNVGFSSANQLLYQRMKQEGLVANSGPNELTSQDKVVTQEDLVEFNQHMGILNTVAVLMARHIRSTAESSLEAVACFFESYAKGASDRIPAILVSIELRHDQAVIEPPCPLVLREFSTYVDAIVSASQNFPRIDDQISNFPSKMITKTKLGACLLQDQDKLIRDVKHRVSSAIQVHYRSLVMLLQHFVPFAALLNGQARGRISALCTPPPPPVDAPQEQNQEHHPDKEEQTSSNHSKKVRDKAVQDQNAQELAVFTVEMAHLQALEADVESAIDDMYYCSLFGISCHNIKSEMKHTITELVQMILRRISSQNVVEMDRICSEYDAMATRLRSDPIDSTELTELAQFYEDSKADIRSLGQAVASTISPRVQFLLEHGYDMPTKEQAAFTKTFSWPTSIVKFQRSSQETQAKRKRELEVLVRVRQDTLVSNLSALESQIDKLRTSSSDGLLASESTTSSEDNRKVAHKMNMTLSALSRDIAGLEQEAEALAEQEQLLDLSDCASYEDELANLKLALKPFENLWTLVTDTHHKASTWKTSPLAELNAEEVEKDLDQLRRSVLKCSKEFDRLPGGRKAFEHPLETVSTLKAQVEALVEIDLPLMQLFCTPGIRPRHWKEIAEVTDLVIELPVNNERGFTLTDLLKLGLQHHTLKLEDVCVGASKEYSLEKSLDKMLEDWTTMAFQTKAYRETGTHILTSTEDMQQLLDDHIVKTQAMRGSRYNKPYLERIQNWEQTLNSLQDIMDNWVKVQVTWLYLEPIFSSDDIMRQMPKEGRLFQRVDSKWRTNMDLTIKQSLALEVVKRESLLQDLTQSNVDLETIQKGLSDYLETKRLFFPRFFFLSNDELLEILAETKDPLRVQPHLKKAFDGIAKLQFEENLDITAMLSPEGECVAFPYDDINQQLINPNDSGGNVECWLVDVETTMRKSIALNLDLSVRAYSTEGRLDWIQKWPGQIVLAVNQIMWTQQTEAVFANLTSDAGLESHLSYLRSELTKTVELVRGELPKLIRMTLGALVVMDVHNRDTIAELMGLGISDIHDFDWLAQLRYYWHEAGKSSQTGKPESLECQMINARALYAYEYLGNSMRLVITPLTDRCYRTLMGAIHLNLGGAPEGPAGTGKTETTKDLAKAIAIQCVVTNCSDGLDYLAMGKFFKGLASSGAWACFDEFNRIQLEVLSVIAQQILCIQLAKNQQVERFVFEGTDLALNPTCCPFITMNPGYAGRAELPDNLKVLFRTVAMMVPDYSMIAEIMLYSYGYFEASEMSKKITTTYTLCSEQLSAQPHYDYGMRAVMAVLRAAGNLKRSTAGSNLEEGELILRSIIDVNLPKFLSHDVPLFHGITSDLFPGISITPPDQEAMLTAITDACEEFALQQTPAFVDKVIQIYEMMIVRHGFMIVGLPFSGKSSAWKVLARALATLHARYPRDERWTNVDVVVLNPKSVTMGQLYGEFDPTSHEWTDGILAVRYRHLATSTSADRKWLIFDGPVDAIWIENMNTVLDDNRKLCLMSGEIIAMSAVMSMMFEPMDLLVASPATVSRCGMIYMEPECLGWRPLLDSWLEAKFGDDLESRTILETLFRWLADPCMVYVAKEVQVISPVSDSNLIQSCLNILESKLAQLCPAQAQTREGLECSFLFALTWSIGVAIAEEGRAKFDTFVKNMCSNTPRTLRENVRVDRGLQLRKWTCPEFENNHGKAWTFALPWTTESMYDVYYDPQAHMWTTWSSQLVDIHIPATAAYSDIVVPTMYTVQMESLLTLLLSKRHHVLICGPTGTGKSCYVNTILNETLDAESYSTIMMSFSAKTSAAMAQSILDGKLDKRRKGVFGPPVGKQGLVFVDDLNMPEVEVYGAQPPIELLRQLVDQGGYYDLKELAWKSVVDTTLVAAMGPAGGGRNALTPRFLRHFNLLGFTAFDDTTLSRIFSTIVSWHFGAQSSKFSPGVEALAQKSLVVATLELYRESLMNLLPTPRKSHYSFNLRDFSRIVQGVTLIPNTGAGAEFLTPEGLVRLWTHESLRVIGDRLVDEPDRVWFHTFQQSLVPKHFQMTSMDVFGHLVKLRPRVSQDLAQDDSKAASDLEPDKDDMRRLFFGDYRFPDAPTRVYAEIDVAQKKDLESSGLDGLILCLSEYLKEYNAVSRKPMNLVMFLFAVEHVSRISRILKMPRGNALLVGVGGSGRQSLTRLSAFMMDYDLRQIEISKNYTLVEWRDDLKAMLSAAGVGPKPVVFLFSDNQIKLEGFVEDINNLLNSGEIPNLFPYDEKVALCELVRPFAKAAFGKAAADMSPSQLFAYFITRVRSQLHVVLAFSPIGDAFRDRLRKFPSLTNCCTIDWFTAWPADALVAVAETFLADVELASTTVRRNIVSTCQHFHVQAKALTAKFASRLGRTNYVTPTSYLELILAFKGALGRRRELVMAAKNRYLVGLEKLQFAESNVSTMRIELEELQPVLDQSQKDTDALMVEIQTKLPHVQEQQAQVEAEVTIANAGAAECADQKASVEADLAEAIPALEEALGALDTIKASEIDEVKKLTNPPAGVKLVCEGVCVMLGIKSNRIPDPQDPSKRIMDYWGPSQKMLSDSTFLASLKSFDKDNLDPKIMKVVDAKYIADENFSPEKAEKASKAAAGLCKWVHAMALYNKVSKVVAPKREALKIAEEQLESTMKSLNEKKVMLAKVEEGLEALQTQFDNATRKKLELQIQVELTGKKLVRASTLIESLGGEKTRWTEFAQDLGEQYSQLTGDVLISSAVLAYLGPFTSVYRQEAVAEWVSRLKHLDIPASAKPGLTSTLGDAVQIREWNINGLPTDIFSIDNGNMVFHSRRWPLMIDPQGQANKWIRNMESQNKLEVIKLTDRDYLRTLENAVQFGTPVLLENVAEELDPSLESLLLKQIFKQGGVACIRLGDATVEYSEAFRFYMTTKLRNPHYLPDVSVKVTLINFMITPSGLEDQLLGIVVREERPDLEEQKNALIIESAENKRRLKEIEDKILFILSSSEGNILEDELAITTLNESKVVSDEIKVKQGIAEATEAKIDLVRQEYRPVAYSSQVLFFCIDELGNIEPVYLYSLSWFIALFVASIRQSEPGVDLSSRLAHLDTHFTYSLFRNVCRSLLEKDKLLFSVLLTLAIMQGRDEINAAELMFFLTGGTGLSSSGGASSGSSTDDDDFDVVMRAHPASNWLSEKQWTEACRLSSLPAFRVFAKELKGRCCAEWQAIYDSPIGHTLDFPGTYAQASPFHRLLLMRVLRPDLVVVSAAAFVKARLGAAFLEPPTFDLSLCYADSHVASPLIFILSPGSDPISSVLKFGELQKRVVDVISLGQGQGPIAERLIASARESGSWVVLQNCHLAPSWMPTMEKVLEELSPTNTHVDFRLWCTTYPSPVFPSSVLQSGVKMTQEPPAGVRANLIGSYTQDPISEPGFLTSVVGTHGPAFRTLLYSLCFFHALVRERRTFGPLGWNIAYEFNESDLSISIRQLAMFLQESREDDTALPMKALRYCTGECNYGGRVTDDKDRRTLHSILSRCYNPRVMESGYTFDDHGRYKTPPADALTCDDVISQLIEGLPLVAPPDVFGLHENATITKDQNATSQLCRDILKTQASGASASSSDASGGSSPEELIDALACDVLSSLPPNFDMEFAALQYPVMWRESMNTVLCQELVRFNTLLSVVRTSCTDLRKAVKGLVVMSLELEQLSQDLLFGTLPRLWAAKSYPSRKPLSSYIADLKSRVAFFDEWLTKAPPSVYWISGFFFTQAFLTGACQNFARRYTIPIDQLTFEHHEAILPEDTDTGLESAVHNNSGPPEDGVFVRGLFLEGARWNASALAEATNKVLFSPAPTLWFKPVRKSEKNKSESRKDLEYYACPVYKTSERRGTLSTTGHSTNFICFIELVSNHESEHWVRRGVAMLSQLDD